MTDSWTVLPLLGKECRNFLLVYKVRSFYYLNGTVTTWLANEIRCLCTSTELNDVFAFLDGPNNDAFSKAALTTPVT